MSPAGREAEDKIGTNNSKDSQAARRSHARRRRGESSKGRMRGQEESGKSAETCKPALHRSFLLEKSTKDGPAARPTHAQGRHAVLQ